VTTPPEKPPESPPKPKRKRAPPGEPTQREQRERAKQDAAHYDKPVEEPPQGHPSDLVDRLNWIINNRTDDQGNRFTNSSLSEAAGLSRSHVYGIVNGLQSPKINLGTAISLARAGNVRTEWLLTGVGRRDYFEEVDLPRLRARVEEIKAAQREPWVPAAEGKGLPAIPDPLNFNSFKTIALAEGADPAIVAAIAQQTDFLTRLGPNREPDLEFWQEEYFRLAKMKTRFGERLRAFKRGEFFDEDAPDQPSEPVEPSEW